MREREEWRCALEECGGLCVMIAGAPPMLLWCAGSWDLKWMYQGNVSLFLCPTRIYACTAKKNVLKLHAFAC